MEIPYSKLTNNQLKDIHIVFEKCQNLGYFKQHEYYDELLKLKWLGKKYLANLEYYRTSTSTMVSIHNTVVFQKLAIELELAKRFIKILSS
jgi:hypothetical protein